VSAPGAGIPRSAWLAVGVAAGAAAVAFGLSAFLPLVAGLVAIAVGRSGVAPVRGPRGVTVTAAGVGAVLLGLRVLAGPPAAPPTGLPEEAGPWRATVESMSSARDGSQVARLRLGTAAGEVQVAATLPAFPVVAAGAVVEVDGRLRPPPDDDPYGEYLRRTGASGSLEASEIRILAPPDAGSLQGLRDAAGDALRRALPEPEGGLAAGILIGLRERVDRDLAADFATAGASHVVAISGWNIAIVAGLVAVVLRGRSRRVVAVVMGGTSPSVVRAAVMAAVVLGARESGRAGRAAPALGMAAAILMLADPAMVGDAGFRLSVMATAGLLAWATPFGASIARLGRGHVPRWLAESLGITLAAQAATLPDVLATFGRLSLVSPVVNLAVVPLVPAAMAGGVAAMAAGGAVALGAPPLVGTIAGLPGWLVLHLMVAVVRFAAGLPLAAVALAPGVAAPAGAVTAVAILAAPWIVRRVLGRRSATSRVSGGRTPGGRASGSRASGGRASTNAPKPAGRDATSRPTSRQLTTIQRWALITAALVVAISTLAMGNVATRGTRLVMLDVGQGDAILLESRGGARMLVDGGPDPDRLLLELDARIPPWDRRVDILVLTHPHEDHVAGLVRVLERYRVGRVYEPGMRGQGPGWEAWDAALRHGPPRSTLAAGAVIRLDEIGLNVLWPEPGGVAVKPAATGRGINDTSIVLLGAAAGRRFLLTGDAEDDVDPALLARGLPPLDVLKVAHHGSATATSTALLATTRPTVALISVGAGNDYGHPTAAALGRLRDAGARVYRTDRDGAVEVDLRPEGVSVRTNGARRTAAWMVPTARASPTGYDPSDDDPLAVRGRPPAALAGTTRVVHPSRVRRGRRGGVAGPAGGDPRPRRGHRAGGHGRAPARRGQAAGRGDPVGRGPPVGPAPR
jgi:competence protein ComEC